ncbi:hypothetical protein FF1_002423 [Malus domestica]
MGEGCSEKNHLTAVFGKLGMKRATKGSMINSKQNNKKGKDEGCISGSVRRKGWRRSSRGSTIKVGYQHNVGIPVEEDDLLEVPIQDVVDWNRKAIDVGESNYGGGGRP